MLIFDAKIISNKSIAKDIYLLSFKSKEMVSCIKAGQFLMLKMNHFMDPILRRPFSISFIDPDNNRLFILYKIRGKVTKFMSRLKEGDHISIIGPLGNGFDIPENISHLILLGGGIGIAPLISLIQQYKKKIIFIAGYKSQKEFINIKRLIDGDYPYIVATEDGSLGFMGTVVELFKNFMKDKNYSNPIVISCGPLAMLKEVAQITKEMKIPCYVSLETKMACGMGICQGCVINGRSGYLRVCKEGPVFNAQEICWEEI